MGFELRDVDDAVHRAAAYNTDGMWNATLPSWRPAERRDVTHSFA
jgi:hypothetical protein